MVSITGGPAFTVEQSVPTDPDTISIPAGDKNPLLILATLTNVGSDAFVGIPSSTLFTTAMGDPFFLSGSAGIVDGETVNEGDGLTDMATSPPFTGGFILESGETKEFVFHLIYGLLCNGCAGLPGPVLEPAPCGETLNLLSSSLDLRIGELVDGVIVSDPDVPPEIRLFAEGSFPLAVTVTCDPVGLYLTHLGNGGGLQSDVVVFDPSSTASASGEVNFFDDDGTPLDSSVFLPDGNSFTLAPLGSATLSTTGAGDLFTGSATVTSDTPISAVIRFDIAGVGVAGVAASQVLTSAIAPVRRVGTLSSGVAFRNVGSDPIQVTLELKDENGNVVSNGTETRTLAGNAKIAEFIETLFPNAQTTTFTGTICVSVVPDPLTGQSGQIAVIALELDFFNNVFTTLPVSAVN